MITDDSENMNVLRKRNNQSSQRSQMKIDRTFV